MLMKRTWGLASLLVFIRFAGLGAVIFDEGTFVFLGLHGVPGITPLLSSTAAREAVCAMTCLQTAACRSFSFRSGTLGCRLFPRRVMALDLTTSSLDAHFSRVWASCPTGKGYVTMPGTNKCILVGQVSVNWTQAVDTCGEDGGHLLIIENADVMNKLQAFLPPGYYHVGFNDVDMEDSHLWMDATPVQRSLFQSLEPSDASTAMSEDCGMLSTYPANAGLHDIPCYLKQKILCSLTVAV